MRIITMKQLLQNPTGFNSASFARRDLIIANLESRYNEIKKRKIDVDIYYERGDYYFHFKIPSETFTENLYYDVVLQFIPVGGGTDSLTINDYMLKVFSNSPNFLFTYAYVFNKDDLIVSFLKDKINKLALTKSPTVKNPSEDLGFEKSIYFSMLYIKEHRLQYKSSLKDKLKKLDTKKISKSIDSADKKLQEYNKYKDEEQEKKKKEREKLKQQKASKSASQAKSRTSTSKTTHKTRDDISKSRKSSFNVIKPKKAIKSTNKKR